MNQIGRAQSRKEWLLSDAPETRRQARLGAFYQGWLTFRGNKLAMLGLIVLVGLIGMAILAPWIAPQSPFAQDLADRLQPPSAEHWLGTDALGRDILSRLIWGSRITLFIVGTVALISPLIGLLIGPLFVLAEMGFAMGLRKEVQQAIEARSGPVRHGARPASL